MTITSDEKFLITALTIAMFNATPGAANIETIATIYEENNKDINITATQLADLDLFKNQFKDLDNTSIADIMISHFGLVTGEESGDIAHAYFLEALENNTPKEEILINATIFLLTPEIDSIFDDAVNTLANKIEVSDFYSITQNRSASTLIELQNILASITEDEETVTTAIELLKISPTATISSVVIADGNYTYGGEVNITVTFADSISLIGTNVTLDLMLGTTQREATLYATTSNSLLFKYVVEDGIFTEDATVKVIEDSMSFTDSLLKDSLNLTADTTFIAEENILAIISDKKAPSYTLYNSHYDTDTNILTLNGTNFNTLLEFDENSSLDISSKLDFTKLTWDIDGDENTPNESTYLFESSNISSSKVENDNTITIVITDASTLEENPNYDKTGGFDTIDIDQGFMIDTVGNISTTASVNNLLLGVDNFFYANEDANILYGTSNDDVIMALASNDILYGKEGNDKLFGGSEDDFIVGGSGIDVMSGEEGNDIFSFNNKDSVVAFSDYFGIDIITDLVMDDIEEDKLDLDVKVQNLNDSVMGSVSESTFITDINNLLSVENIGFNIIEKNDISASHLIVTEGDFLDNEYLVVDYNANDSFDEDDFIVNITGANISNISIDSFI